ncbi:hypothetical protein [Thalassotalea ganghwensis]
MFNSVILFLTVTTLLLLSGCSTMGTFAKSTFASAKNVYALQPESVRNNYPHFVKKKFYTSELLTTEYDYWRLRILANKELNLENWHEPILVELAYEVNQQRLKQTVELILIEKSYAKNSEELVVQYDFSFSKNGASFWQEYQQQLFAFNKPWFNFPLSPQLPINIRKSIIAIHYNYAPNWGYLSLREFMDLYDLMTDKHWNEFCEWSDYRYNMATVCGNISYIETD